MIEAERTSKDSIRGNIRHFEDLKINSEDSFNGTSKKIKQMKPRTVVFGVENVLCLKLNKFEQNYYTNRYPDLEEVKCCNEHYFFFPYWKILFDYLLSNNCLVYFFSNEEQESTAALLETFLIQLYDEQGYKILQSQGQFKVYSRQHWTLGKKSLQPLLKEGQSRDDCVMVDKFPNENPDNECEVLIQFVFQHLNVVSRLLGLFMTYFEEYESFICLREIVAEFITLIPDAKIYWGYKEPHTEHKFIVKGLLEIRKSVPDAVYHILDTETTIPIALMPSLEYVWEVLDDLNSGKRSVKDPNMILFERQFTEYIAPYYANKVAHDSTHCHWRKECISKGRVLLSPMMNSGPL